MAEAVYALCAVTSIACAVMLWRGFDRSRARFLLWSSLCFLGLAVNNILLFADKVMFPDVDLAIWRTLSAASGMLLLMFGLIWDTE